MNCNHSPEILKNGNKAMKGNFVDSQIVGQPMRLRTGPRTQIPIGKYGTVQDSLHTTETTDSKPGQMLQELLSVWTELCPQTNTLLIDTKHH